MLKGTPYWGKSTFYDLQNLVDKEPIKISCKDLNDICIKKGLNLTITDVYTTFLALSHLDWLFVLDIDFGYTSWCRDIRFNYRDKKIFIPYYSFSRYEADRKHKVKDKTHLDIIDDKTISLKFDFSLNKFIVDNRELNVKVTELLVYDINSDELYLLDYTGIPYLSSNYFDIDDLYKRYINSCFIVSDLVDAKRGWKYNTIQSSRNEYKNNENRLRTIKKLPHFIDGKKPMSIKYMDVRSYPFEEIMGYFMIDDDIDFDIRRYLFEAYLYCIFAQKIPCNNTKFNNELIKLRNFKRYIRYGEKYPLILKYYYYDKQDLKNHGNNLRKKTYERFRT